jgi:hypothetical protein
MRVGFALQRTASAALDVGSVLTAAAASRRFKVYEFTCGSEATPVDSAFLWQVFRRTGVATNGAAATITNLDQGDTIASTLVTNAAPTANGAGGSIAPILSVPLNQRATYRWVAAPGSELVSDAAASQGFAWATPTAGGIVVVTVGVLCEEL